MKTIYAVTQGEYSDYHIVALFSSTDKAQDYMDTFPLSYDEYNEIEAYQLDPPSTDMARRGYSVWSVLMTRDGTAERVFKTDGDASDVKMVNTHNIWRRSTTPAYRGRGIEDALDSYVWAKTEKQAVKIVNEKRAQMIAMGEW